MLTMKGKYGLKAMVHLAGCRPGAPESILTIATEHDISKKFLDAILASLRVAGLVVAKKGKGGGYTLARHPSLISIGEIIRVLDGPLAPIDCASRTRYRRCSDCRDEAHCTVRRMMVEVRDSIARVLDNRSLEEMRASAAGEMDALTYQI